MGIITGFIEGLITFDRASTPTMLPFADKIKGATFNFTSETIKVETFSAAGILGNSAACDFREACSWELMSENLTWSFIQAVTKTLDNAATTAYTQGVSVVLSTDDGTDSTIELSVAPAAGVNVIVADENGTQYATTVSGTTVTLTGEGILTGRKVIVSRGLTPGASAREIQLGSADSFKLPEVGLYGTFKGCPDDLIIVSNRVSLEANLSLTVGEGAATASMTGTALRDNSGNFARIINLNPTL